MVVVVAGNVVVVVVVVVGVGTVVGRRPVATFVPPESASHEPAPSATSTTTDPSRNS